MRIIVKYNTHDVDKSLHIPFLPGGAVMQVYRHPCLPPIYVNYHMNQRDERESQTRSFYTRQPTNRTTHPLIPQACMKGPPKTPRCNPVAPLFISRKFSRDRMPSDGSLHGLRSVHALMSHCQSVSGTSTALNMEERLLIRRLFVEIPELCGEKRIISEPRVIRNHLFTSSIFHGGCRCSSGTRWVPYVR